MPKYLLAAAAAMAISSPAIARDGAPYIGIEGGVLFGSEAELDFTVSDGTDEERFNDGLVLDYGTGLDVDFIAGYDFGMARAELELGYKRVKIDDLKISDELADALEDEDLSADDVSVDGRTSVVSLMGNLLLDLGGDSGIGFYAGGGLGRARVKVADERDSALAWQLIVGAQTAVADNIDVGLKYRYFNTGKLRFHDEIEDFSMTAEGKFRSHSLLASLVYNFGPSRSQSQAVAAPPPPPAPVATATQTCADGSVILATDMCPAPVMAPPPPPPPVGERG